MEYELILKSRALLDAPRKTGTVDASGLLPLFHYKSEYY